jgi:hypothetical protein
MMRQPQKLLNQRIKMLSRATILGIGLALGVSTVAALAQSQASASDIALAANQQSFASAADAVTALIGALQADDTKSLVKILGPGGDKLVQSGDPIAATAAREQFLELYAESHTLTPQPDGSVTLVVGNNAWPLPIPIVQVNGHWQFDATIGAQVIIDRRIGRNELLTIQTLLSAVAGQEDYFDRMKAATGTGVYAQRLYSSPGKHDGLYWDVAAGEEESPLGPLIDQAEDEGYPGATQKDGAQTPFHGYYFRLLKGQGPDAPGGAANYIQGGKMTGGFAYVAWPALYDRDGIMTFLVDQDGIVFQKDLGPDTYAIAATMTLFDPDLSWARVVPSD